MKKVIKTIGAVLAAGILMVSTAQAGLINLGFGPATISSNIYLNTDVDANNDGVLVSQGIGQVYLVTSDAGTTFDSSVATSEFNFIFDNITLFSSTTSSSGTVTFGDILGDVTFFDNSAGTFVATGDFAVDSAAIASGNLLLDVVGHGVGDADLTVEGTSNGLSISGNGQLDVIGGLLFNNIVQDTLATVGPTLADMTFNFSGDNQQTSGYTYSGNATFKTATVPEPGMFSLLGLGMVGMLGAGVRRRKQVA